MTFEEKLNIAHAELQAVGIWKSNYNPPLFDLARRLGYKTAPPHYRPFLSNFLRQTLLFFIVWGGLMWLFSWQGSVISGHMMFMISSSVSLLFGFMMAVYYKFSAKHHHLSNWHDFK
ncbi:DUF6404 family protein [Psychromonas hadalis]|uniref:DUF6404 family protein n=1 Tax=Psychromonas hadalis TaxID=211669 RepID=UPI0003B73345|nr:DUF6404 family protein [Psychromonas hadalis]